MPMGIAARPTRRRAVTRTGRTPTRDDRRASRAAGRLKLGALAGLLVVAQAVFAATPAHAQQGPGGGDQGVAAAQARADTAASAYIDALFKSQELDAQIAGIQDSMARLEERVTALRDTAQIHALAAYKRGDLSLSPAKAKAELDKMMSDPKGAYRNANAAGHKSAVRAVLTMQAPRTKCL